MSDDEVDHDLLAFMREALSAQAGRTEIRPKPQTHVLTSASYIVDNAIDIFLSRDDIVSAARDIYACMQKKAYSTHTWSQHSLHPSPEDGEKTVDFIFTMDLLNFSFWCDGGEGGSGSGNKNGEAGNRKYEVAYNGQKWSGYWSLVAALRRALEEDIPITSPSFWTDHEKFSEEVLGHVFRVEEGGGEMPMLRERMQVLREAGEILCERYDGRFAEMIAEAENSAAALVVLLAEVFPCFRDEHIFEGRKVNFYKRAQILVADLWACFNATSFGHFTDIDELTMFADYRVPMMLHSMRCLQYGPKLEAHIKEKKDVPSGSSWELQIRGGSVWCVEMIRRQIEREHPGCGINAVLIDFYLYDTAKEMQEEGLEETPHHRTRSIWY